MKYSKSEILNKIKGQLIVSCQALPGEPLYVPEKSVMYLMARAAKEAGSPCIRTSSIRDVPCEAAATEPPSMNFSHRLRRNILTSSLWQIYPPMKKG